ncbi:MAG: FAD-dependent oxidoreductase, partial [Planctomycetota bacterium]|nr:FAD-dependent oxidoreductase [Planctomycetota bacterium]
AAGTNRVAVVGAGRDGLRAATLLATTGVEVTLFDRRHRLLEECDSEMVDLVVEDIGRSGIRMRLGEDVLEVGPTVDGAMVVPIEGDVERFDRVVVAVGRVGNTDALGLERVGLETDERGRLWCDERFNTWVEGVCAVGSVIGHPDWLRNSLDQGKRLAVDVLFSGNFERGPAAAVTSSGTRPEILQAGRTTEELMAEGVDYESGRAGFVDGAVNSLKLLWTRRSGRVLGAHATGPDVAASIGRVAAGMRRRLTIDRLLSSCGDDRFLREAATATGPLTTSGVLPATAVAPPTPIEGAAWRIDAV